MGASYFNSNVLSTYDYMLTESHYPQCSFPVFRASKLLACWRATTRLIAGLKKFTVALAVSGIWPVAMGKIAVS